MQRTQRNELLHGKGRRAMYKKDIQSCCFVCSSVKKNVAARKAYTLDKRYFFIRATKEANSVCSVYEHDHESFHHNFQSCQVWLYCSARLDRQRRQSDMCTTARAVTIRWNYAMWLVKPCVACVKLEHGFNSSVALRALSKILRKNLALRTLRS